MSNRRNAVLRACGQKLALAGIAVAIVACAADGAEPEEGAISASQALGTCSVTITTNTYVGSPDWWGTLAFTNNSSTSMTSPQIDFQIPSGATCDYDEPGWTHTQSGTTCTYTRTSSLTIAAGASYTFYYSTTSSASFTAANVQISSSSCGGTGTGGSGGAGGSGGSGGSGGAGGSGGSGGSGGGLTANQKKVAEAVTSIWENDTPVLNYAYSEDIDDGRGYTSGRAGFCTGTGDAIQVIQCYNGLRSAANGNLMAKYMPGLTTINNRFLSTGESQASTAELDVIGNWTSDWATSYNNSTTRADFKACQDQVSDALYYTPAMSEAAKWGLTTALTKAALYDAFINHGEWGAQQIIAQANTALGNSGQVHPVIGYNGITESAWLQKFLEKRRNILAADSTWIDAVDRVAIYEKLRRKANWDLAVAFRNDVRARDCWGSTYPSSGYTVRAINPDGTWSTPSSYTYSCN